MVTKPHPADARRWIEYIENAEDAIMCGIAATPVEEIGGPTWQEMVKSLAELNEFWKDLRGISARIEVVA